MLVPKVRHLLLLVYCIHLLLLHIQRVHIAKKTTYHTSFPTSNSPHHNHNNAANIVSSLALNSDLLNRYIIATMYVLIRYELCPPIPENSSAKLALIQLIRGLVVNFRFKLNKYIRKMAESFATSPYQHFSGDAV